MKDVLKKVCDIARKAGKVQLMHFGKVRHVEYKGAINLVTEVDKECEALIVGELQKNFPAGIDFLHCWELGIRGHPGREGANRPSRHFPQFLISSSIKIQSSNGRSIYGNTHPIRTPPSGKSSSAPPGAIIKRGISCAIQASYTARIPQRHTTN
jgi:hypothetical protein